MTCWLLRGTDAPICIQDRGVLTDPVAKLPDRKLDLVLAGIEVVLGR